MRPGWKLVIWLYDCLPGQTKCQQTTCRPSVRLGECRSLIYPQDHDHRPRSPLPDTTSFFIPAVQGITDLIKNGFLPQMKTDAHRHRHVIMIHISYSERSLQPHKQQPSGGTLRDSLPFRRTTFTRTTGLTSHMTTLSSLPNSSLGPTFHRVARLAFGKILLLHNIPLPVRKTLTWIFVVDARLRQLFLTKPWRTW